MRTGLKIMSIFCLLLSISSKSVSQNTQIYKHPTLNIQFEASKDWIQIPRPEDKLIYEVKSPDSIIHVILWYTTTEQSGRSYLEKMASMKDLIVNDKPFLRQINNHDVWVLNVPGYEQKIPIRTLLAVITHGKSKIHPRENCLFIVQILCKKKNYEKYKNTMENILSSIQLNEKK